MILRANGTQLTDLLFGWPHAAPRLLFYLGCEHQVKLARECLSHSAAVSVIIADVTDQEKTRQLASPPGLLFMKLKGTEKMTEE